jgi:hypothetical protein
MSDGIASMRQVKELKDEVERLRAEANAAIDENQRLREALRRIEKQGSPRNRGGVLFAYREMQRIARETLAGQENP